MRLLVPLLAALLILAGCSNNSQPEVRPEEPTSSTPTEPSSAETNIFLYDPEPAECVLEGSVVEGGKTSVIGEDQEGAIAYGNVQVTEDEIGRSRSIYTIIIYPDATAQRWVSLTLFLARNDHTWRVSDVHVWSDDSSDESGGLWVSYSHISLEHDGTGGSFQVKFTPEDDHADVMLEEVDVTSLTCVDEPG